MQRSCCKNYWWDIDEDHRGAIAIFRPLRNGRFGATEVRQREGWTKQQALVAVTWLACEHGFTGAKVGA